MCVSCTVILNTMQTLLFIRKPVNEKHTEKCTPDLKKTKKQNKTKKTTEHLVSHVLKQSIALRNFRLVFCSKIGDTGRAIFFQFIYFTKKTG